MKRVTNRASDAMPVNAKVVLAIRLCDLAGVSLWFSSRALLIDQGLSKSGTGKSQFSHYFKTKDGLAHAVLQHLHAARALAYIRSLRLHSSKKLK